ncbi:zona pellucida sperm-binding protein 3 receptor-like [Dendropsophus ebraccatus]|uniref:zona pellucida sperm-binding protein 3 receptor-like n=1 Tax=Dendropsophus ebraccatus TaxID=150705 RepID=UPI003830FFBF
MNYTGACSKPNDLPYAAPISENDTYEDGDQVTYSCLTNYTYVPTLNNISTCENGSWSAFSEAFCRLLDCGLPDVLINGNVKCPDTVLGSTATYTCLEG